jgi:8-oxo-dGTP diphosphatase
MARASVLAAGGIVLRQAKTPEIAVVRLRKRNEWVLPKGKLDDGETARDAAMREVLEETGHDVAVHEFLGTLVYESGGRSKVVHYWRMETSGGQAYELMDDIKAVDWLPLDAAVARLSRSHERAFLENVGPLALEAAALARPVQAARTRKQPVAEKRRRRPVVAAPAASTIPVPAPPDLALPAGEQDQHPLVSVDVVEAETSISEAFDMAAPSAEEIATEEIAAVTTETTEVEPLSGTVGTVATAPSRRISLVQKMRDWLRRAA